MGSDVTPIDIKFLNLFKVVKPTISSENQLFCFPCDVFVVALPLNEKKRLDIAFYLTSYSGLRPYYADPWV